MKIKLSQLILVLMLAIFMVPTMVSANGDTSENTGIVTPQDIPHQWVYVGEWREPGTKLHYFIDTDGYSKACTIYGTYVYTYWQCEIHGQYKEQVTFLASYHEYDH